MAAEAIGPHERDEPHVRDESEGSRESQVADDAERSDDRETDPTEEGLVEPACPAVPGPTEPRAEIAFDFPSAPSAVEVSHDGPASESQPAEGVLPTMTTGAGDAASRASVTAKAPIGGSVGAMPRPTTTATNQNERSAMDSVEQAQLDADPTATAATAAKGAESPASGSARPTASTAATASAAARAGSDPLAKLLEGARVVVQRAQGDASAQAVAGRLDEVEASIARDRVAKAVDEGALRLGAGAGEGAAPVATATVSAQAVGPVAGANLAANAGTASSTTTPAQATQATDALVAGDATGLLSAGAHPDERTSHPSAQLAARGMGILANQRGGAITMRLDPPALGQLRIELQVSQGAVVADFTAATPEARVLLEANLGMLRERLESQGLTVERISVHGARGTESTAPVAAPGGGDARQDGASARSDSGDRGDRGNARQDAAGGESRGRRDGDARAQRDRTDAARQGDSRGFAATLNGETARRTEPMRRAG